MRATNPRGTTPPPHPTAPEPMLKVDCFDDQSPEVQPERREASARREVGVKVFFRENGLRERVKAAGGRWSKVEKLWQMPYKTAVDLGLKHRIAKR